MEDDDAAGYAEPCAQCSAVNWGVSDEGRFYCRSCHNITERTQEVVSASYTPGINRVTTLRHGPRTKTHERGRVWMVCEGFQFILKKQADALLALGVGPHFQDDVLHPLWIRYLQQSRQAYTSNPLKSSQHRLRALDSDSDSAAESIMSVNVTDGESNPPSTTGSYAGSGSELSGSVDASFYLTPRRRRSCGVMSMKKNLALIYLALVWSREALTLGDLLRLVIEGHVPYVNAYEQLPEEMKLTGTDALLFKVKSVPSHSAVHKEAQALTEFLQLPAFPPISSQTLLHPTLLSLRYLTDANLPDELHPWVCRLVECAGMTDQTLHTFDPVSCPLLPRYDVRAAALIIVTIKVIFGMDDSTECGLCNEAGFHDDSGDGFNLRRWYRLMKAALTRAEQRTEQYIARKQWTSQRPIFMNKKNKVCLTKRKRIAEQVQLCFEKLSSRPADVRSTCPSSFKFRWGDEDGSDGPSLQHMKLDRLMTLERDAQTPSNCAYWHPALQTCSRWKCGSHYSDMKALLPRSFVWLLQLFSFLLDVEPHCLYEEVLSLERRLFSSKTPRDRVRIRKRTRTSTGTPQRSEEMDGDS